MKHKAIFTLACAGLMVAACSKVSVQTASAYTVGAADSAYYAAEKIGEQAVANRKLSAASFHDLSQKAYSALLVLRTARAAGNSQDIATANAAFNAAIAALNAFKGN
jgi:hypothetical protein